ncbi:hypothetical protein DFH08DRAFT_937351 [Mycena albidolilacea]|uniref:Uncharacterized protein n=1 Tax=Mycena albidolilacea TaxID=1033008 RepID=A0AAD7ESE2_9AGAR|nr:hypothetical protein DFH08DRAFT_937351 [Mycena albidolilacea]
MHSNRATKVRKISAETNRRCVAAASCELTRDLVNKAKPSFSHVTRKSDHLDRSGSQAPPINFTWGEADAAHGITRSQSAHSSGKQFSPGGIWPELVLLAHLARLAALTASSRQLRYIARNASFVSVARMQYTKPQDLKAASPAKLASRQALWWSFDAVMSALGGTLQAFKASSCKLQVSSTQDLSLGHSSRYASNAPDASASRCDYKCSSKASGTGPNVHKTINTSVLSPKIVGALATMRCHIYPDSTCISRPFDNVFIGALAHSVLRCPRGDFDVAG